MWGLIIEGALLGLDFVYHRYLESHPPPRSAITELTIPRTDVGAPVPLIYGKVRARSSILAWTGPAVATPGGGIVGAGTTADYVYGLDQLYVIGVPFNGGDTDTTQHVHGMWVGEKQLIWAELGGTPTGDGGFGPPTIQAESDQPSNLYVSGFVEWLNGKPTQVFVDGSGTAQNNCAQRMLLAGLNPFRVPSYRGLLSVFLYNNSSAPWYYGIDPSVPAHSFEVSSYVNSLDASRWPATYIYSIIGEDSNPMNVLYDLLGSYLGKLGLDRTLIDMASFNAAAHTLSEEGHGYSRYVDQTRPASEVIGEILSQIDAALYEDPVSGLIGIKLIRPDFDPLTIPRLTRSNCSKFEPSISGPFGLPNHVRVTFTNRSDGYRDGTAEASNQANAIAQGNQPPNTLSLSYPGICTQDLGNTVAGRELAARSRSMIKAKAVVSREAYRWKQGDPIMVYWDSPGISGIVFRVANVNRKKLSDNEIELDLIQDFFYTYRGRPPIGTGYGGHDIGGVTSHF